MIEMAMLMLLAGQTAPEASVAEEMVVIGQRLRTWRGRITPAGAALRCVTTTSTGDAEIDRLGCSAMVACFTPMRPRMEASADRRRAAAERRAIARAVEHELGPCLVQRNDRLVADLVERRHQARQGTQNAAN